MRKLVIALAMMMGLGVATTGNVDAFGVGSGTTRDVANEEQIRKLYDGFGAAWNAHDVEAMSARWALDGDHVEPDGTQAKGRFEVKELLEKQHAGIFKDSEIALDIESVWFVSASVALVDGGYSLKGIHLPDGTEIPARKGKLTSVLLLERDEWWIVASRLMIPTTLPYKESE